MDKRWQELFALKGPNRRPAYVLVTSLLVLMCICLTLVFEYRYYANQAQLEQELTKGLVNQAKHNLRLEKAEEGKRYLEFDSKNR